MKGETLKQVRLAKGQTQEQAAREVGCTLKTWGSWERGKTTPKGLYAESVGRWLGEVEEKLHEGLVIPPEIG